MDKKKQIKEQMARNNTFAIKQIQDNEGKKTYVLKGCYQCQKKFIARKQDALTCSPSCSSTVSHKLSSGQDLSNRFTKQEIATEIDFEKYPFRSS